MLKGKRRSFLVALWLENSGEKQIEDCSRRAAKKILTKLKGGRPSEATIAELIAAEFEELTS